MPKPGIKFFEDTPGEGAPLNKGDRVRILFDIQLHHGDFLTRDRELVHTIGDREVIAGLRYGLEGMREGGRRRFKASPHLCYRDGDAQLAKIPPNAVLIFDIKRVEIVR